MKWLELAQSVRAAGRIDYDVVHKIAMERTARELKALAKAGLTVPFNVEYDHQRTLTEQVAKAALDNAIAERQASLLSPNMRAARALELRAEIADTAIPPQPAEAARFREQAEHCRQAARVAS